MALVALEPSVLIDVDTLPAGVPADSELFVVPTVIPVTFVDDVARTEVAFTPICVWRIEPDDVLPGKLWK